MQPGNTNHNRDILQTLIDDGARIAKLVLAQAEQAAASCGRDASATEPGNAPQALTLDQATIAYDRVTRTVRRAIALLDHLDKPRPEPKPAPAPAHQDPARQDPVEARTTIIRTVEDAIHNSAYYAHVFKTGRRTDYADCRAELYTRIDRPEFDHELATRPVSDIIDDIARDLEVWNQQADYKPQRRTIQDLENLAARAARTPLPHPGRAVDQLNPPIHPQPTSLATQMARDLHNLPGKAFEPALKRLCHQMETEGLPRKPPK